ncbi:hypothetical protein [Roseateles sp. BYS87W]|uniref:Uncharacterized protein n=1 Tax=Pelomonas baiyunensis TaxID=3299026 RepID=A0ABW7GZ13_9BURK
MGGTAELNELLQQEQQLKALAKPVWLWLALVWVALVGVLGKNVAVIVVGCIGTWLVGPWVIQRAVSPLRASPRLKLPLFLSCALPVVSLAAPLYVWQRSRTTRDVLASDIRLARALEQQRDLAPADAVAAAVTRPALAAEPAPAQEALPVLRAVAAEGWPEGEAVMLPGVPKPMPPTRGTAGVFAVGYHVEAGEHWSLVGEQAMQAAGLNLDLLHRAALTNLRQRVKQGRGLRLVERPDCFSLKLDGEHEACMVLVDGVWDRLFADKTPNGAVVAIPAHGQLHFCDAHATEGLAALRAACRRVTPHTPGALFQGLLRRRDGRWTVLETF